MLQIVFMDGRVIAPTACQPAVSATINSKKTINAFLSIRPIVFVRDKAVMSNEMFYYKQISQVKKSLFKAIYDQCLHNSSYQSLVSEIDN